MSQKINLPYDYLADHSVTDLQRLLKNADMFTPETVANIEKLLAGFSQWCLVTRIVECTYNVKPMDIDVEFVEGLIAQVNMDETLAFEYSYILEEAEVLLGNARNIQEAEENEWEHAINNPDHPRYKELREELNAK